MLTCLRQSTCRLTYATSLLLFWAHPALAHGDHSRPLAPSDVWHAWNFDPWLLIPIVGSALLYGIGIVRLWGRAGAGRGISAIRIAAFMGGELALIVALISPLDALGETLLTAHMVQHGILIAVAPPLIILGSPGAAFAWMLPAVLRRRLARFAPGRTMVWSLSWLLNPIVAAAIHGMIVWLWHVPAIFDAALANRNLHMLEHFSFLASALLFWQGLRLAIRTVPSAVIGMAAAFATMFHGGFLGALITFAPFVLFEWYVGRTTSWGLEPLQDQQLAGLTMWVPLGIIYFAASLILAARLLPASQPPGSARQKLIRC